MANLDEITVPVKVNLEVIPTANGVLTLLFCSSKDPISWSIRELTWSDWSHVAILAPDGVTCYEVKYPSVRKCTLQDVLNDNDVVVPKTYPCEDPKAAIAWCETQVGLPYDVHALFGFLIHRDWAEPGAWFCSEYAAMAFEQGGSAKIQRGATCRVTPQMLWVIPGIVGSPYRSRMVSPWPTFVKNIEKFTASESNAVILELTGTFNITGVPISTSVLSPTTPAASTHALELPTKENTMSFNWSHFQDICTHLTSVVATDAGTALDFAASAAPVIEALPDGMEVNAVVAGIKAIAGAITPVTVAQSTNGAPIPTGTLPMTGAQAASAVSAVMQAVSAVQAALPK